MSTVLYRASTGKADAPGMCLEQPPEFECPDRTCDSTCAPECACPPKTKAKYSEAIGENERSRCVSLRGRGCSPVKLPMFMHCIEMKVRRKGSCSVLTTEVPYKAKYDGSACFNWSNRFKRLEDGYYEGDVYINGKSCYTWPFHIRGCYVQMVTESTEHLQPSCSDVQCTTECGCAPAGAPLCCEKPTLDIEPVLTSDNQNCSECDEC